MSCPPSFRKPADGGKPEAFPGATAAFKTLNMHLLFNLAVMAVGLPLMGPLMQVARRLMPEKASAAADRTARSALDLNIWFIQILEAVRPKGNANTVC